MSVASELAKCSADPAYFTDTYGIIDDAQGHGDLGGIMPFRLWPAQIQVMWQFVAYRMILMLKARQLGMSWLCCAYALWLCIFQDGKVVLIFSKGQDEANIMLERIKKLYERLPDWMRDHLPILTTNNTTELAWNNGSVINSLPATQSAGRSRTASLVIVDEMAFLLWADKLFTALKPTIDGGGQLIMLSTANGVGNLFHQLWVKSVAHHTTYHTIFLPWWSRPDRDVVWYQRQVRDYNDPDVVKQEYPASAHEAFLVSGRTRFKAEWIQQQQPRSGLSRAALPESLQSMDGLIVYSLPRSGRRYIIPADVAEGLDRGDFDAAFVLDRESWEEVAVLHGKWEPDQFTVMLQLLADVYHATIAPERNNHGHAVIATLKLNGYLARIELGHDGRLGWLTNQQTKAHMIDFLAQCLRERSITLYSQVLLNELLLYSVLKNGSTGAPTGYHDDLVMALAIGLMIVRRPPIDSTDDAIPMSWSSYS